MSFRTSLQKSAWSCETNMCSAIDQATRLTTLAGASLRSSCAHPKGFRRSASFPRRDTTHPATKSLRSPFYSLRYVCLLACGIALFASTAFAQIPVPSTQPPPPRQYVNAGKQASSIKVHANLVVLQTTVLDDRQRFAAAFKSENFHVFSEQ